MLEKSSGQILKSQSRITFGQISFTNTLPVVVPLEHGLFPQSQRIQLSFGTPAELNGKLSRGVLDVSAMSSFYFLESGEFELLDTASISSSGPVGSVLLFTSLEPGQLDQKVIEVTDTSATSIRLLQILLKEQHGVTPVLKTSSSPGISSNSSGALLIGDQALAVDEEWSLKYIRFDLGQWWHQISGLPAVFGLWGARRSWVKENKADFEVLRELLGQARDAGLTGMFDKVLETAKNRTGLPEERLKLYFKQELDFSFSERHRQGLQLYEGLCRKHGLFDRS